MPVYPINVLRHPYGGNDPRLRRKAQRYNEIAQLCEDYLNLKISENADEIQQYTYGFIAHDLNLTTEEVHEVMFAVAAGHNGITVHRPSLREGLR